jgi:hypothetical protein
LKKERVMPDKGHILHNETLAFSLSATQRSARRREAGEAAEVKDAKVKDAEVKDERLKPATDNGSGITNDHYSRSDSTRPRVKKVPKSKS